jgi:hypothetical protein
MAPAFIRLEDGRYRRGKLRTISLTGGLLHLQKPHLPGTLVEVVFVSSNGPVLGVAELMTPVSATLKCLQPFKFIMIDDEDYRKLGKLIEASMQSQLPRAGVKTSIVNDIATKPRPRFPSPEL